MQIFGEVETHSSAMINILGNWELKENEKKKEKKKEGKNQLISTQLGEFAVDGPSQPI